MFTIKVAKSGLSLGFFFRHRSTKSLISSEKTLPGNLGGGWLTMYSRSSKIAIGLTPGVRGVRGWGEAKPDPAPPISSATCGPNNCTRVVWSGGGIGYWPKLISSKERPRDQRSLATEYWEPCGIKDSELLILQLSTVMIYSTINHKYTIILVSYDRFNEGQCWTYGTIAICDRYGLGKMDSLAHDKFAFKEQSYH